MSKVTFKQTRELRMVTDRPELARSLPHRERLIAAMRADRRTRAEIAEHLGLTVERVRSLEAQTVARLRDHLKDTPLGFYLAERFGS